MRRQVEPALQGQQGGLLSQQDMMPAPPDGHAWLGRRCRRRGEEEEDGKLEEDEEEHSPALQDHHAGGPHGSLDLVSGVRSLFGQVAIQYMAS